MRIKGEQNQLFENSFINRNRMDQEMEKLIWEYIDGQISPIERERITRHLAEDLEWQIKYKELQPNQEFGTETKFWNLILTCVG